MFSASGVQSGRRNHRFQKTLSIQDVVADLAFWVFHPNISHLLNVLLNCFTNLGHFSSLQQNYISLVSFSELLSGFCGACFFWWEWFNF